MTKKYRILIPDDPANKGKEQVKVFQRDGVTIQVPIGKYVEVPDWIATTAKDIGLITDYLVD